MAIKWTQLYQNIMKEAVLARTPVSGFFELTNRCNLHCKMCYICSSNENEQRQRALSSSQWIKIGQEARDAGLLFLTLTGGEIFIRKDFWDIYDAFAEMGFNLTLFTNASLLDKEKVHHLAQKPPAKVSITLYGAGPETYGRVTGHPEAFDNTVNGIKYLLSEGITVIVKTTVIKGNSDEFGKLMELTDKMGLALGLVNYVSPRREGTGTDPEGNRLSPVELARYEMCANKIVASYKKNKPDLSMPAVDEDIMTEVTQESFMKAINPSSQKKSAFVCGASRCAFWLTWDGKLTPCGLLCEPFTEPLKTGFSDAWKALGALGEKIPVCNECESCSDRSKCMACPARLKSETGVFNKPAPYLCDLIRARDALKKSV